MTISGGFSSEFTFAYQSSNPQGPSMTISGRAGSDTVTITVNEPSTDNDEPDPEASVSMRLIDLRSLVDMVTDAQTSPKTV